MEMILSDDSLTHLNVELLMRNPLVTTRLQHQDVNRPANSFEPLLKFHSFNSNLCRKFRKLNCILQCEEIPRNDMLRQVNIVSIGLTKSSGLNKSDQHIRFTIPASALYSRIKSFYRPLLSVYHKDLLLILVFLDILVAGHCKNRLQTWLNLFKVW